ncbi:HNH endonuclease [Gluconobacter japonicus]|uniref:HNH endonuclease signature motif containing protein n=1 Tax=Gluconobacter japonicus TaxID=376620 RepID=UPI00079ABF21|nr:HNH endonuclease [Gluconobacter japonicus]KXV36273.1 HNH endonuclease [Gluconobacter japonicus]KXV39274.1 HNH endonuclease [Gluconobacter japonicus]
MALLRCINSGLAVLDTSIARVPPKTADAFYVSKEWRSLMATILKQRGRVCERCGRTGCRIFGDHIIELKDGGAKLDPLNVQLLCGSCHTAKTAQARARRTAKNW